MVPKLSLIHIYRSLSFPYLPSIPEVTLFSSSHPNNQVPPILGGHLTIPYRVRKELDTTLLFDGHILLLFFQD